MTYTPEQQLFVDFFNEALNFMEYSGPAITIVFCDFDCIRLPSPQKSASRLFPVRAAYPDYRIAVHQQWAKDIVSEKLPTPMRIEAYYTAYGYHYFFCNSRLIKPYPQDSEALAFATGLALLNGVPVGVPPFVNEELVLSILHKFSHRQYAFIKSTGSDGHHGQCLSLSSGESKRLLSQLQAYDKEAEHRRLDVRFGTEDHPFGNIDEAIEYIEFLERDAVEHDLFLNSSYNRSPYRYDVASANYKGREIISGLFKIPWASAYTAHIENSFPKNSFVVTQLDPSGNDWEWLQESQKPESHIPLFALKPNLSRRRFLFRGQYEEFTDNETKRPTCRPNLYRPDVEKNPLPHRIKAYEMACLVTRHPLVQQLGVKGVKIFNEPFRFQLSRLGLAQHYYNKTAFLDLTSDIEVAKFFACCKYDWNTDRYFAHYPEDELGIIYLYDMRLPYEFKNAELPRLSSIGKQYVFLRSAMQSGFLLNMPEGADLHDYPNVYRIYFRHSKAISEEVAEKTRNGDVYFPKDALSLYWKNMYKAPNSDYTISLKAREMYLIQHPRDFSSAEELDKALTSEGFRLGKNKWPEFPVSILDDYYSNSRKLWSRFCSDIFFIGSEGYFMKKALEELISDEQYRQAFFK